MPELASSGCVGHLTGLISDPCHWKTGSEAFAPFFQEGGYQNSSRGYQYSQIK